MTDPSVIIEDDKSVKMISQSIESNIRDEMNTTKLDMFADQKVKRLQIKNIKIVKGKQGPPVLKKRMINEFTDAKVVELEPSKKKQKLQEA